LQTSRSGQAIEPGLIVSICGSRSRTSFAAARQPFSTTRHIAGQRERKQHLRISGFRITFQPALSLCSRFNKGCDSCVLLSFASNAPFVFSMGRHNTSGTLNNAAKRVHFEPRVESVVNWLS
jgi:hypothetical protein